MLSRTRTGAVAGLIAAVAMTATPSAAAELPAAPVSAQFGSFHEGFEQSRYDSDTEIAQRHRRWGRWSRRGRHHRHNRIDGGDVLAGVLILGGIAAIASAANNNDQRERVYRRDRNYDRDYDRDYDRNYDRRETRAGTGNSGLDNAAEQCVSRIERDVRVDTVDGVNRTAQGWTVTGSLYNGEAFVCQIDENGSISSIDYGGLRGSSLRGSSYEQGDAVRARGDDRQWSDANYADARRAIGTPDYSPDAEPLPAYPGGPLPGDEDARRIDGDLGG